MQMMEQNLFSHGAVATKVYNLFPHKVEKQVNIFSQKLKAELKFKFFSLFM